MIDWLFTKFSYEIHLKKSWRNNFQFSVLWFCQAKVYKPTNACGNSISFEKTKKVEI